MLKKYRIIIKNQAAKHFIGLPLEVEKGKKLFEGDGRMFLSGR